MKLWTQSHHRVICTERDHEAVIVEDIDARGDWRLIDQIAFDRVDFAPSIGMVFDLALRVEAYTAPAYVESVGNVCMPEPTIPEATA